MLQKVTDSITQLLFTLLALYLTYLLLRYPTQALAYASQGLLLWFEKMIPTLLPFMILSGIMIRMNLTGRFAKWFHPLFHWLFGTSLNGSYVLLMGMLCGFPMGARIIGELCQSGRLSEEEGAYLLSFCNNIGPIYFISFVMDVMELNGCWLPFLIMYGVPVGYGIFWHFFSGSLRGARPPHNTVMTNKRPGTESVPPFLLAVDDSILSGLIGIGKLGGYMVFFNLLNIMMLPFHSLPESFLSFGNCILEITSGISRVGERGLYLVLILLPFGGFSCMAQTYSMIRNTGLSMTRYVVHKCVQTACTALIYAFCFFFGVSFHIL